MILDFPDVPVAVDGVSSDDVDGDAVGVVMPVGQHVMPDVVGDEVRVLRARRDRD